MKLVGTFEIPRVTPSTNIIKRMHWAQRRQEKKMWCDEVFVACAEKSIPFAQGQRTVEIISYRKRLCDPDRFIGGLEYLIDCMVELKILVDDRPKYLVLRPRQEIDWHNVRTEVKVWE